MRQTIPEDIRAATDILEGFNMRALADELSPLDLSATQIRTIASMIAIRGGCDVFTAPSSGEREAFVGSIMVNGRNRTIVLGSGKSLACFLEGNRERLIFFPRPGQAGLVTLRVDVCNGNTSSRLRATLTRDEHYRYFLDDRWIQVVEATGELVQCAIGKRAGSQASYLTLQAEVFWPFVFSTSSSPQALLVAQISAAHVASLLGLSLLTIERRIGEGKLPAVRLQSKHPGVCLSGLREFLAYRKQFPQGHPNLRRIEVWQQEWRQTYHAEVRSWLSREAAGASFLPNIQESRCHE